MSHRAPRTGHRLASILFVMSVAHGGKAQTPGESALAQSLFDRARDLMADHRFTEACPMLAESQRLDPGGGTILNLAVCHEGEGKLATAWSDFSIATSFARKDGRRDREELSQAHRHALEARLSYVVITVPASSVVPGLTVTLDGTEVRSPSWGVPTPVDPGEHRLVAEAPDGSRWTTTVTMEGDARTLRILVPRLGAATDVPVSERTRRVARISTGIAALASLGVSVATGVVALVEHGDAESQCDMGRGYCATQSGVDAQNEARTLAWVSTITLGAAVAGAAAYLFWPRQSLRAKMGALPRSGGGAFFVAFDL
jgi:hypothetical protein